MAAVIALAKANGWTEFVRVKEELAKSAVKDAVLKNGQVIEGVRKVEGERVYEVKVAEVPDGA
jgi:phage host-nuclease inhibitor protein Gam